MIHLLKPFCPSQRHKLQLCFLSIAIMWKPLKCETWLVFPPHWQSRWSCQTLGPLLNSKAVSIGWIKHLTEKWGIERGRYLHWWDEFKRLKEGRSVKLIKRKAIVIIAIRRNESARLQVFSGADGHESRIPVVTAALKLYIDYWKVRVEW